MNPNDAVEALICQSNWRLRACTNVVGRFCQCCGMTAKYIPSACASATELLLLALWLLVEDPHSALTGALQHRCISRPPDPVAGGGGVGEGGST